MRFIRELIFDFREIGIQSYVVLGSPIIFAIIAALIIKSTSDQVSGEFMIYLYEIIIPAIGGYGAIVLMQGVLDTEGGEISFTYQRSFIYWGLIRQARLFGIQMILNCISSAIISYGAGISFLNIFMMISCQCFAVMGISFLGVASSKKVSIGIVVLIAFVGIQISLGQEYPFFNRIYVFEDILVEQMNIIFNSIIIGLFGYIMGQTWMKPR